MRVRARQPNCGSSQTMPPNVLDRKPPANPKYAGVQPRLNTGFNMRKAMERYEGTSGPNAHKKRRDEFYVRLKPTTLGQLLSPALESSESVYNLGREDVGSVVSSVIPEANSSCDQSNILIYDLRSFEEFQQCHCYGARHYDVADLNKASNNFPREVYFFKGPVECDKMIVLYDEDGKSSRAVGNGFVEKGIENTYVVSGGFLGLCAACPQALVGELPDEQSLAQRMSRAGLKAGGSVASSAMSARCSTAGSVRSRLTSVAGSQTCAWK